MTRVILVRHGETTANRDGVFSGYTDVELLERGRIQAKKTSQYIAENYQVDRVYASDLKRAYETVKMVADLFGLEVTPEKGMREIFGGVWEGVKFEELMEKYADTYGVWLKDIGHSYCPEGESVEELGQRIMATLTRIADENQGKTVVVGTHATPVRVMQCLVETGSLDKMKDIPWVTNASITEFKYEEGKWTCVVASLDDHLGELCTAVPKTV